MKTKNLLNRLGSFLLWSFLTSLVVAGFAAFAVVLISIGLHIDDNGVLGYINYPLALLMVVVCASDIVFICEHIKEEVL